MDVGFDPILTMAQDPRTIAQLKRKIERLEARLAVSESELARVRAVTNSRLYAQVDAEIRIKQALCILLGQDQ